MRVVILGGRGNFGARIARSLSADAGIEVLVAGRRAGKASIALDLRAPDFGAQLAALKPGVLIHCAGPFQHQDYGVAQASIDAGAHYIDLSDARAFVAGFSAALDARATRAGVLAVTGASTLPALSTAVIDALQDRYASLESVDVCIAPGQHAPRGVATMQAVLGYAGKPFTRLEQGAWKTVFGWQSLRRIYIDGLEPRLGAACDVPDLELLPLRYPGLQTARFDAALEVSPQVYALAALAGLRRAGIPVPTNRLAATLNRLADVFDPFGSSRGGMQVLVTGRAKDGRPLSLAWSLIADDNHGPEIPCMAALIVVRKLARHALTARGATPCTGLATLAEFEAEFAKWRIRTSLHEQHVPTGLREQHA